MESIAKKAVYRTKREKNMYHRKMTIAKSEENVFPNRRTSLIDSLDNNDNIYSVLSNNSICHNLSLINNLENSVDSMEINPIFNGCLSVQNSYMVSISSSSTNVSSNENSLSYNTPLDDNNDIKEYSIDIKEDHKMDEVEHVIKTGDEIDIQCLNDNLDILCLLENGTKLVIKDKKLEFEIYYYLAPITRWYGEQNHTSVYKFIIKLFEDTKTHILSFKTILSKYNDVNALEYSTILKKFLYANKGLEKLAKTYEKYEVSNDIKKLIENNNEFYNNEMKIMIQKIYKPYSK